MTTYADNTVGADQFDQLVLDASLCVSLAVGLEVAQVTDVALLILGGAVSLVLGVDLNLLAAIQPSTPSRETILLQVMLQL